MWPAPGQVHLPLERLPSYHNPSISTGNPMTDGWEAVGEWPRPASPSRKSPKYAGPFHKSLALKESLSGKP